MQNQTDRWGVWAVVQYLSLTLIMQKSHAEYESLKRSASQFVEIEKTDTTVKESAQRDPNALWSLAHLLSLYDLNNKDQQDRIWAHRDLIELYLISLIMNPLPMTPEETEKHNDAKRFALLYTDALIDIAGRDSFEVYSTRRQILRYLEWYSEISDLGAPALNLAEMVFEKFPPEVEDKWK
jgi:hypothetical protein